MRRGSALLATVGLLSGCERAGADFQNATDKPATIVSRLRSENANGATSRYILRPGQALQSVWFVSEYQDLSFEVDGHTVRHFYGPSLSRLASECPKHCILQVTPNNIVAVKTDLFGKPLD